jgi:hypothetical protein
MNVFLQLFHRQLQRLNRLLLQRQPLFLLNKPTRLLIMLLFEGHRPKSNFPTFFPPFLGFPEEILAF